MGFKFGYTKFVVGIVEVEVTNIDTDKGVGTFNFEIPTKLGTIRIEIYSGKNWQDVRAWSAKIGLTQPDPEPKEEDREWLEEGDSEEEST